MLSQRLVGLNLKVLYLFLLKVATWQQLRDKKGRTTPVKRRPPLDKYKVSELCWYQCKFRVLSPNLVSVGPLRCAGAAGGATSRPRTLSEDWFRSHLSEADAKVLEHSGKMVLLFQILKMAEELGDKVYAASSICRPAG